LRIIVNIIQTLTFKKQIKKLHKNQKSDLDKAVKVIANNPSAGNLKKGDLYCIYVYKFKMVKQLVLLAYEFREEEMLLIMLTFGTHENFYRDLKN